MTDTPVERPRLAQRYDSKIARASMAEGKCPECGNERRVHGGWGGPGCLLTDGGVFDRVAQFEAEVAAGWPGDGRCSYCLTDHRDDDGGTTPCLASVVSTIVTGASEVIT